MSELVELPNIEKHIFTLRGVQVMLDRDLAELYEVPTKSLNLAVRRNKDRFPDDFTFQLTAGEAASLRFQFETSKTTGRGGRRYPPHAFTEHGVAMLSSVLHSKRAVQMNIIIIRAFIRLREVLAGNKDLARRIEQVEAKVRQHGVVIGIVVDEIKRMKRLPAPRKRRIGFVRDDN